MGREESLMSDRKLIRPSMNEMMEKFPTRTTGRRKQVPAEQTNAESFYYLKQMQNRTAMVVVLTDGTELKGWIEWYDKNCLKLNRVDAPNLLLQAFHQVHVQGGGAALSSSPALLRVALTSGERSASIH
jgi:sRNA-binding regulator protein Hfq